MLTLLTLWDTGIYEEENPIMMKRIFALLLCAATLLTSLAFVGCESEEEEEDKGQYITAYLTDNVYDLDPARAYNNEAMTTVVGLLFDTLFKLDENGKVKKSLVDDYVIEEDEEAGDYTMKLYLADTKWSDGTSISANDIVFAWQRLLRVDADFEAASLLFDIKNARAAKEGDASIDDVGIYPAEQRMLEINFEGKIDYDQFLLNLTSLALTPLRDEIVSKGDDWAKKAGTIVCSGPFKLGRINYITNTEETYFDSQHEALDAEGYPSTDPNSYCFAEKTILDFQLERNTYYYRDFNKDKLDKSVKPYKITVDCSLTDAQVNEMYEKGMLLYMGDIPLSLRSSGAIADAAVVSDVSMSTNSIYLNQKALVEKKGSEEPVALFAIPEVRKALSMAIDRQAIANAVVYAEAATGLVPNGVFEADDRKVSFRDACTTAYSTLKTDASGAAALLSGAGVNPADYSFDLTVAAYDDVHCAIAELIVSEWTKLGFNVTLKKLGTIQNNDYYKYTEEVPSDICDDLYAEELRAGRFDAILLDYVAYSADAFSVLSSFAKAFSGRAMDMSNLEHYELTPHITGYDSEAYNELMETIFAEKTISKRASLYRDAEAMLMEDMPIIPVVFNLNATVTSENLRKGLGKPDTTYTGHIDFKRISIRDYEDYLAIGKAYLTDNFDSLAFNDYEGCTYNTFELFKTANTIYMQYFLDEKVKEAEKDKDAALNETTAATVAAAS